MVITDLVDAQFLRNVPGWKNAPVPVCMGGDYRALTFCCKPGYQLTFAGKCRRDQVLKEIGMDPEHFMELKEKFSQPHDWGSDSPCFGSLSYCCMRRNGCYRRDFALAQRYPQLSRQEIMEEYFSKKRLLAELILRNAANQHLVAPFLENL